MKLSINLLIFVCLSRTSLAYPTRDELLDSSEEIHDRPTVLADPESQDESIDLLSEKPLPINKENSGINRPESNAELERSKGQETQSTTEQPSRESSESGVQNPGELRPQGSAGLEQDKGHVLELITKLPSGESEEQPPEGSGSIRSAENERGEGQLVGSNTDLTTQESTKSGGMAGMSKPEGLRQRRSRQSSFTPYQETATEQPSPETTESELLPESTTPESLPESVESLGMPEERRQPRHV